MAERLSDSSPFPYSSYAEYVSRLLVDYPEYYWLNRLLSSSGRPFRETHVQLIDIVKDKLSIQRFPKANSIDHEEDLKQALRSRPANVSLRVVYVRYQQTWSISREVINVIGLHFRVNPLFFWGNLHHYYSCKDALCPNDMRGIGRFDRPPWIAPLPSDRISLELACMDTGLSALFLNGALEESEARTVIVLCRSARQCESGRARSLNNDLENMHNHAPEDISSAPDFVQNYFGCLLSTRYETALRCMSPQDVCSANEHPVELIYPFVKLLLLEASTIVQRLADDLESQFSDGAAGKADTSILQSIWARRHDIEVDMRHSLDSFTAFAAPASGKSAALIADFTAVMEQIRVTQADLRDYLAQHVSMKSLEQSRMAVLESRKSIEQANGVKRLTQIALVFVPVNLATSLFGMNMVEFGNGTVHLWVFVVVTLGLCLAVAAAAFQLRPRTTAEKEKRP